MKFDTLYLHVGWSKTGTSAIQRQIQLQRHQFLEKGILYPQSLQWPDHSHHPFALSFRPSGSYKSDMTPAQALEKLALEMSDSQAEGVLISSELSPFYFNNPRFQRFVEDNFHRVKVIFTIRRQSELLVSLFNQLIKDPNVRYSGSLFTLAMRNIAWLTYFEHIKRWANVVGKENTAILNYSSNIVRDFLSEFEVLVDPERNESQTATVNPSIPTRCLAVVQAKCRKATDNASYIRIRDAVIEQAQSIPVEQDRYVLFSVQEQQAFDDYFMNSNKRLEEYFDSDFDVFKKRDYSPVKVLAPGFNLGIDVI